MASPDQHTRWITESAHQVDHGIGTPGGSRNRHTRWTPVRSLTPAITPNIISSRRKNQPSAGRPERESRVISRLQPASSDSISEGCRQLVIRGFGYALVRMGWGFFRFSHDMFPLVRIQNRNKGIFDEEDIQKLNLFVVCCRR